ncbi:MAG TPA: MlaD family protein [Candidatus Dormibacteraeota bacterium]|nr:MlaD family protein [Candidatus Dormibacteraeota bacterium]
MRSRWNAPVYAAYAVICALVAVVIVAQIGVSPWWVHHYQVTAVFRSGDGILKDNEVFLNGVKVGRVDDVTARGGEAYVTMRVDDTAALPLHADAGAVVRKKNLLGETYVELTRGTAPGELQDGSTIPDSRTASPVDIDTVLAILDPQTRDRLQLLVAGAGDSLDGNGTNLNSEIVSGGKLFQSLQGPSQELTIRSQQVDGIVLELEKLTTTLAAQRDQVRAELTTWSDVMGQLAAQEQAIGGTLQQADTLFQSTDSILTGEVPTLRSAIDQLSGTLDTTQSFLTSTSTILAGVSTARRSVHDTFPSLQSTFADTDPNSARDPITGDHQHYWSVFSIFCQVGPCSGNGTSTSATSFELPAAPNTTWAAAMGSG